jgi:hypothetical protein
VATFGRQVRIGLSGRSQVSFEAVESRLLMSSGPSGGSQVAPAAASAVVMSARPAEDARPSTSFAVASASSSSPASSSSSAATKSGDKSPIFDFSDAFYLQNGIDPTKIAGRPNGDGTSSVVDTATDPTRRNVRVTAVVGGHDDGGNPILFSVLGTVKADAFTNDAAGRAARQIADKYVAYIFPKAGSNPLSPAAKRQDELIPLNNGYFSNDPTQIWREVFVNYVPGAASTPAGRKVAQDLMARNGPDGDGTPMVRTMNDLDKAREAGLVTVTRRADDGSQGAPWFFCAVYKDPRGGAITADATLAVVRNPDGTVAATSRDIDELFAMIKTK